MGLTDVFTWKPLTASVRLSVSLSPLHFLSLSLIHLEGALIVGTTKKTNT